MVDPLALFLLLRGYKAEVEDGPGGWLVATWQLASHSASAYRWPICSVTRTDRFVRAAESYRSPGRPWRWPADHLTSGWGVSPCTTTTATRGSRTADTEAEVYGHPPSSTPRGRSGIYLALSRVPVAIERPDEKSMFPGVLPLVFAIAGLGAAGWSVWLRFGLGASVVTCTILSLGYGVPGGRWLFGALFRYFPGWQTIRTPGRLITFTTLGLALLGSIGAERMRLWLVPEFSRLPRGPGPDRGSSARSGHSGGGNRRHPADQSA